MCSRSSDGLPRWRPSPRFAAALGEFASYIANNARLVVNYGERLRAGERTSAGFVESAVNQIVDKRFDKRRRCVGRNAVPTCCCRLAHASSTVTSINLSVPATVQRISLHDVARAL
jgi:hypothetical protein